MKKSILVVEDDPGIRLSLKDELISEEFVVIEAKNGEEGLEAARNKAPDLIILDVMMPVLNGYEVCKRLRREGNHTPILILTVKDKEIDKVLGLELGADDYVTKPFSLREVVARVKAILRRNENQQGEISTFSIGNVHLDFRKYEAHKGNVCIELTPLEFRILKIMIMRKEQVVTRDDILDAVWGEDNMVVSPRTIDSHIANIRKKIEDDASNPKHIVNIWGVGYKMIP
ncbi:MAG: DNA-binding response regulator [Ignavibacteria bacterium RBG_16_36_9]|nr:MAG: DNA-binding response regulator [Ignavibacteria bacterium RBG_16_36_9]